MHMVFDIIAIVYAVFVIATAVRTIESNSYLLYSDFYNVANDDTNHFGLIFPFYLNLFVFGPPKEDLYYFCSNAILLIVLSIVFIINVSLELLKLKETNYVGKLIIVSSYIIYRFVYAVSYALTENYLNSGVVFSLATLLSFFGFYAFSSVYGILIDLKQQTSLEQYNTLIKHIKKCSIVSGLFPVMIIVVLLADSNFVHNYIPIGLHHSRPISGFSKIYKSLIDTSLYKRVPSLLFFVFVSALLIIAALIIFMIIIKKHQQIESSSQETTDAK